MGEFAKGGYIKSAGDLPLVFLHRDCVIIPASRAAHYQELLRRLNGEPEER